MTDQLRRLVDERVEAHTPQATPPFTAILARRRRRQARGFSAAACLGLTATVLGLTSFMSEAPNGEDRLVGEAVGEGPPYADSPPYLTLPTHPDSAITPLSIIQGRFNAARSADGLGCAWLERPAGRTYVRWPDGFALRAKDLALVTSDGLVVATLGQNLAGGGGSISPAGSGDDVLAGCEDQPPTESAIWDMYGLDPLSPQPGNAQ